MKNIKIKFRLLGVFLRWCWMFPDDIKENYHDIKTRYFFETDKEMKQLMKEIDEL